MTGFCSLIYNTSLQWFIQNESTIQQGESTNHPLVLVNSTHQHFYKAQEMLIADALSHWNKAWVQASGVASPEIWEGAKNFGGKNVF